VNAEMLAALTAERRLFPTTFGQLRV
jgi:hypothetical protein